MRFQTFTVVVGTKACNAHCPFCISKQTGLFGTPVKVNWRNFHIACNLAVKADTTTVLLTGKGEPTLYPDHITETLEHMQKYDFPLIEMQTNGITIADDTITERQLEKWYGLGLTTIALSVVHWDDRPNGRIYQGEGKEHFDLSPMIEKLHKIGFSVRLCVMLLKDYIDTPEKVGKMVDFARANKVEQLTFRNITATEVNDTNPVTLWTKQHALSVNEFEYINLVIKAQGTLLYHLMHGMDVYDVNGQNVCVGNCLTRDASQSDFRQLIFFPDGSLYYDWQYKGARIL
jgi:molybdenum cofactor biosynthesis enzyme MoaA